MCKLSAGTMPLPLVTKGVICWYVVKIGDLSSVTRVLLQWYDALIRWYEGQFTERYEGDGLKMFCACAKKSTADYWNGELDNDG